jgi:ElaB/YqjD/DUF883 family membrane-anchored ribosome-binding protein
MRQFWMACVLVLPICCPALGQSAGNAGAALFDKMAEAKCARPDSELIKPGTTDQYNAQAKGFNDCLRVYVENENNKIARIRAAASGDFDRVMQGATGQIRDIERAINTAIVQVRIVNGEAQADDLPPPAAAPTAFPEAACKTPDEALLKPARGKHVASLANLDRHEDQRLAYEACMRTYVAQAKNEIKQIQADAGHAFQRIADDANPRITEINNAVTQALADARKASGERDARMNAFRAAAASQSPNTGAALTSPVSFQPPGTESVIVTGERLPRSADMPTGAGDPDAISCRAPQQLTDSRLMGPEVCKHNRDWARISKAGMNLSPDGTQIVKGERDITFNPQACVTTYSVTGLPSFTSTCGTPGGQ